MSRSALAVGIFIVVSWCCFLPWSSQAQSPHDAKSDSFHTKSERIGGLRLGLPEKDVAANIPCKPRKDKELLEGATGEYVQMWKYPECGVVLKLASERKGGEKTVESITITSPSDLATSRGIHIGSTEDEVIKAYGRARDQEGTTKKGKMFVAGSIYDGMIFHFQSGRVTRIFLGSAAE